MQLSFSRSANGLIETRDVDGNYSTLETLAVGEWYRVEMTADTASDTYDLTLQRYGQTANTYNGLSFRTAVDDISQIRFINNATGATKTTFAVDNVEVIPEPASLGLLLFGCGVSFLFRKKYT